MEKQYDIAYDTGFGSSSPSRLMPAAGERLKLFFVPSVKHGREIVEFIRRTGVDFETVTFDRAWDLNKWGIGDYYDIRASVDDQHVMVENLERALTSEAHYDVLVIPAVNGWAHFTPATRQAVLRRVEAGAGLVLIRPFNGEDKPKSPELEALSPLVNLFEEGFAVDNNAGEGYPKVRFDLLQSGRWSASLTHYITRGIPLELLPSDQLAYYPYEAAGEVLIAAADGAPIAAVKPFGQGRVVAFGYYPRDILPQHKDYTGKESTFDAVIDEWKGARTDCPFAFLAYFYELVYRSVVWAAKREPDCALVVAERGDNSWTIRCEGSAAPDRIRYTIKDVLDGIVTEGNCGSDGMLDLPESLQDGGVFRIEVEALAAETVLDFATFVLEKPPTVSFAHASVSHETLTVGETVRAAFRLQGEPCLLVVRIIDDFGRVLEETETGLQNGETATHEYRATASKSMHITVEADVKRGGRILQRWSSGKIVVTPSQRRMDDFEVFTAPQNRGHGDFLDLVAERYREIGVTGLYPGSAKTLTMSGASGLGVYWYHRAPYVERKEQYYRTRDKQYLVRVPCLNDPAFWEEQRSKITKTVSAFKKFGPIAYFANDEGSLTCYTDEMDLCFCGHCMREMRVWLRQEYANLGQLNDAWGTAFGSWEDIVPYTREEARKTRRFAPWTDHRRFMEHTFVDAYRKIASLVQGADEGGVIRMSGCQASTAYSGYDYYRLHQYVGYFEAYGVGNQYEFHRSFAKPGTIIGGWFGYGVDGVNAQYGVWHAVYHGLTLCNLFWEYSLLNPDYSLSRSAQDLSAPFREIREEGIGKLLLHVAKRDHCGIALHYSMASVRGTAIIGDKTRFESNRQGWIDMLEDLGYQYDFIATQQIEAGELTAKGIKLLVLPYSIALSERETAAITQFVNEGGTVMGDFQTGLMDQHGQTLESGMLDSLFGIERLSTEAEPFYINDSFVANADFSYFRPDEAFEDERMAEFGTRTKEGQPAYRDDFMRQVVAVNMREQGDGKAVYLNIPLSNYPKLRLQDGESDALRKLIRQLIGLTGAAKPASLTRDDGSPLEAGCESFYYASGEAAYVAVLRKLNRSQALGHDGLAVGAGEKRQRAADGMRFAFAKKAHVYDVRERRYVGYTDEAAFDLAEGDTKLFALLPCRATGLQIDAASQWKRGRTAIARFTLASGEPHRFASVLTVHATGPDGSREWLYSDNIYAERGECTHEFAIPVNARTGNWTITVKDTATGIEASHVAVVLD
ncbi:hypothetical protein GZH47_30935 [Paenibacillus rhizovicinus]|uniref:beta-galactosidase n=1 Tax=Paenibacillus rhizovicinus TaxID=2704463 RepID=A0A6C0P8I3_9BACL|nr:beta-galactosidase trimerization domain-containing protein [Paenibacillus rhizovicinus]QHW34779.1 hypothetical protein GZH47_30935 [Paenibacillus rhizovicinus]